MKFLWPFLSRLLKPTTSPAKARVTDHVLTRSAAALLSELGCGDLSVRVSVVWHSRLTSTAGLARPADTTVLLNPGLKKFPDEVHRTLRHELAHLVAFDRARGRRITAHGPEWKKACADLGIPGESRCHTLPLPKRRVKRPHAYRCPRCGFLLGRRGPIKARGRLACLECCKRYAHGRFDGRFVFVKVRGGVGDEFGPSDPAPVALPSVSMVQQTFNLSFPMKESTKDRIKGAVNETSGKIKEKIGGATKDPNLQDQGTGEKVKGKVQGKIGDIKKVFEK